MEGCEVTGCVVRVQLIGCALVCRLRAVEPWEARAIFFSATSARTTFRSGQAGDRGSVDPPGERAKVPPVEEGPSPGTGPGAIFALDEQDSLARDLEAQLWRRGVQINRVNGAPDRPLERGQERIAVDRIATSPSPQIPGARPLPNP